MRENWATLWEAVAGAIPDATAVVQGERRLSYREVEQRAARLATALHGLGLGADAKVAILAYNCTEYLEATYAAFKLRGTPVNLNYRYREDELVEVLADAEADVLLCHGSLADTARAAAARLPGLRAIIRIDDGSPAVGGAPAVEGALDYEALLAGHEPMPRIDRSGDDVFMIYTGGTTGRPRGVLWRHADLVATIAYPAYLMAGLDPPTTLDQTVGAARTLRESGGSGESGGSLIVLPAPPLIHGTAFYLSMGSWLLGGTVVMLESRTLDGHEIWRAVQRERVNQIVIVGDPFARALVRALEEAEQAGTPYDISSLRRVNSSGVLWSPAWKQALADRGEITLVDLVGASEGGPFSVQTVPPGAKVADCRFQLPPRTRLIDEDDRFIDPASGRTGRLAVAPPGPLGYFKDPEKSAGLLREIDGVVHAVPGDYAYLEPDGQVVLLGRGALCINTGGEKVYPQEVETVIVELDGVRDVNVIGLPDEQWGEAVTAVVAGSVGAADVRGCVRERLAGYKVPKHVVFVPEIQRSPAGKARYAWAREVALAALGSAPVTAGDVYVVGAGIHPFGRGEDTTGHRMAEHAVRAALTDAHLTWPGIDYAVGGSNAAGKPDTLVGPLGLTGVPFVTVRNGCATGGVGLLTAANAIRAGEATLALVVGFDKHGRGAFASSPADYGLPEWYARTGMMVTTQYFAMRTRAYLHRHGIPESVLAASAARSFGNGARHPMAWRRTPLTESEIGDAAMVNTPLTRYMFCSPSAGAVALVLAGADRATDLCQRPVKLAAAVMRTRPAGSFEVYSPSLDTDVGDSPTVAAAATALARAGVRPTDVRVAQIQDTDSGSEVIHLAETGLCGHGEQTGLINGGGTAIDGRLPVNTDGGCLAFGEPIGASGLRQVHEVVRQLQGRAPGGQVPGGPEVGFTQVYGAPGISACTVLTV